MQGGWSLVFLVVLAAALGSFVVLDRRGGEDPLRLQAEELRAEIRELQGQVDHCLAQRSSLEARFQNAMDRTEALRSRVGELEGLDPDGVPAERYEEYLEVFDEYNESIPEWERLGEAVREQGARCRGLAEAHNRRLERLQEILMETFSPTPPPG